MFAQADNKQSIMLSIQNNVIEKGNRKTNAILAGSAYSS